MDRIARYAQLPTGGHCLGITVRGVRVLVTPPTGDDQDEAEAVAAAIAAIGPEQVVKLEQLQPEMPPAPLVPPRNHARNFKVGQRVWCNVHNCEGWHTVTEVGTGRHSSRIKVASWRTWCPSINFDETAPADGDMRIAISVNVRKAGG
jgi:hypothetical protein